MKKRAKFLTILLIFAVFLSFPARFAAYSPEFALQSRGGYIVNLNTGTVVFDENCDETFNPAYLTQIMTMALVLEKCPDIDGTILTAPAYIFNDIYNKGLPTADVRPGEEISVKDLLYSLSLQSSCEAANVLADYIGGGSLTAFVDMMNKKAAELGCENTKFVTAHGGIFTKDHQYTTAKDMYKICKYALSQERFREIAVASTYVVPKNNKHANGKPLQTYNQMINSVNGGVYYTPNARGIKVSNGSEVADRCLVTLGVKGENEYLLVLFGAPAKDAQGKTIAEIGTFTDAKKLIDWCFSSFEVKTVLNTDDVIAQATNIKGAKGQDFVLLMPEEEYTALMHSNVSTASFQRAYTINENISAPIKKGQVLGTVTLRLKNEDVFTTNLVAATDIERSTAGHYASLIGDFFNSTWFKIIVCVLFLLVFAYVVITVIVNKRSRKFKKSKRQNIFK